MQSTDNDITLLQHIHANGHSVRANSNVDHRPYDRLKELGWLSSTTLSLPDVAYSLTPSGLKRALEELQPKAGVR
ncbi:hypothetical protein [Bradyrhizobium sp. 21]|uniref:hypothetical protein n=1 Tax=Bradyrhizobium sp. 21 TaxID=2782666 RepID=UPI001FF9476A|nr:hypothetical protein [Bradyrhizobium sp. 21]MCK1385521.1 hypothetical protein [Bradyrhizobium sp. 21]